MFSSDNGLCLRSAVLGAAVGAAFMAAARYLSKGGHVTDKTPNASGPPRGQPVAGRPVATAGVLTAGRVAVITGIK